MMPSVKRDHHIGSASEKKRLFLERPVRELVKWILLLIRIFAHRFFKRIYLKWDLKKMDQEATFARKIDPVFLRAYPQGHCYFEIQIGNETRPSKVLNDGEVFSFEKEISSEDQLLFGVAPLVSELDPGSVKEWKVLTEIKDMQDHRTENFEMVLPYNGRRECFAYFPGDGWVDSRFDLKKYVGRKLRFSIRPQAVLKKGSGDTVTFAVGAPQILKKQPRSKNVLLISMESLTDVNFLRQRYDLGELPSWDRLAEDSVVYPKVYSPTDNTLSFASSLLTGLLPSQHGIGNYAIAADSFKNKMYNEHIVNLSKFFKERGFFTSFGGTQVRYSSKVGWARGFDHYFHVFEKWAPNVPQFSWLTRAFHALEGFDKFFFTHIDYLHDPLISFNDNERPRFHDLALLDSAKNDNQEEVYFAQLREMDFHLGRFLNYLKESGVYDQTAILITGDHGAGLHWVKHNEYSLYEERIRVPLVIKYPDWAKGRLPVSPVTNSVSEIHRALHAMVGSDLPSYFSGLAQYRSDLGQLAFSETIMNPKRQYKKHKLAIMNHPYKYVCWNEIDWDRFRFEAFEKESLFIWDESLRSYREEENMASQHPEVTSQYRDLARSIIETNVGFLEKYPPRPY